MSRPKPIILLEHIDRDTFRSEQILVANALYGVFYEDTAITIRALNKHSEKPVIKYKKTTFAAEGNASALSDRLNEQYNTDKFNVKRLT